MAKRKKVKAKSNASKGVGNKRIEQLEAAVVGLNRRIVHIEAFLGDDLEAFHVKPTEPDKLADSAH